MKYFLVIWALIIYAHSATAQDSTYTDNTRKFINYGGKGFELEDKSGNHLMHIELRAQFRASYPHNTDFLIADDPSETIFLGNTRVRLKIGGHSFRSWLKYYTEYDLYGSNLLDCRVMIDKLPYLKVKVGQWKVQYNRERIISSGKQQTVDRSILTRAFTIDRQQGISVYGNLAGDGLANFNYWLSAFMGTGRNGSTNDDTRLMYMSRLQWNPTGAPLKFSGSDIEYNDRLKMLMAIAGVTNRSQFTRFSTSGGGQLDGFDEGLPGQYRINQMMEETACKYRGFSWQQELHYKHINDLINNQTTKMLGSLFQFGYMLNGIHSHKPKIEFFSRYAFYYPYYNINDNKKEEYTLGANWFISGHRIKTSAEVSYLDANYIGEEQFYGWRYRIQLDISL